MTSQGQDNAAFSGQPNQPVVYNQPGAPPPGCQGQPGYAQPGAPPPGYQGQPGYAQPGAPPQGYQGQPGYAQPGAPPPGYQAQPGYAQPGAPPPGYQGQPGYAQPGAPPPGYQAQPAYGQQYPNAAYGQAGYGGTPPAPGAPQPQAQWMPKPQGIPGCPPGLEYLTQIDQLLVQQKVELMEAFTGWESKNKYVVRNALGQQVFYAAEESDACMRQCCGPARGFEMHITDNFGNEVLRVIRPFKCCAGCQCLAAVDSCAFEVEVQSPIGTVCGYVKQAFSCIAPKYHILDANRQTILEIEGPMCMCQGICCQWDQEFIMTTMDGGAEVGKISKQWSGLVREMFTDADNFGVNFPMDLDVRVKATCLAAVFLIDFMFFEHNQNNNNHHH